MTPSPNSPSSVWYRPTEVSFGPTLAEVQELYVAWVTPLFKARATVISDRGAPVVQSFVCEADGSLPSEVRRLPSDAFVVDAIRRFGVGGIAPLIRLLGEDSDFEARYRAIEVPEDQFALEAVLHGHARLITRRPRAQIQQQIHDVQRMRSQGMKTAAIEQDLTQRFGISRSTAYRRIRAAGASEESQGKANA